MTADLTQEVSSRLQADHYAWLTTVAKSGQPVPRLVWFYLDGTDVIVYSMPNAAKIRHIDNHPHVSLNLDSDGNGGGVVAIGGSAVVDEVGVDPREDAAFWQKYQSDAEQFGLTEAIANYNTRLRIGIEKVWTTPPEPEA
ncbi:TIGR03667 family PPOX class F420-dependent oxidoreductase [Mycolicibacterium agri]|uniref:PPOX class F420-dependent oxidoreductase n=1 Tax=Mycolicibacterium agri TaxID=36811 RepID=A0A2A7N927_MYCAG|nr:TIGR03667 family PPOX class F420-dependent oxidoreductase [Mycolicibacterium agri]PEG40404.1 TIGR03667 family PPOX class F420-dependent oxidoreductase [Mycolicibacterium agri]GFG51895.1 PPOX class F420-dependent oxidoreductase [Mycolicibacterium agri]